MPLEDQIKISNKVKDALARLALTKGETFNDIIIRVIASHERLQRLKKITTERRQSNE